MSMRLKFSRGDEIEMIGTVSLVHDEEYGRRRVTVGLEGFDYSVTVSEQYVHLLVRSEKPTEPKRLGRRKGPLFDVPD